MLDPVEEPLDQISLAIDPGGKGEATFAVGFRRDVGPGFVLLGLFPDGVAVIALVGQQGDAFVENAIQQGLGLDAVVDLPRRQPQDDGTAFRIDERVDFAGETATGTSHAAIVGIPFFPVAPCW